VELILALIGFLAIAVLWAFILIGVLRKGYKFKKNSAIFIFFIFIGIGVLLVAMGAMIEWMDSPEFCGTFCHPRADIIVHDDPMGPFYEGWKEPGNNSIMSTHHENDVTCSGCHDGPGAWGKIEAYSKTPGEMYAYIFDTYDPDDMGGHVPDEFCEKCHDGEHAIEPAGIRTVANTIANPHKNSDLDCADCHAPHQDGIGLKLDACTVCHDVDSTELRNHAKTTSPDCMDCHYMKHPEDAAIPFEDVIDLVNNTFCSDCHQPQFNAVESWSDNQKGFYGNCSNSCHIDHKESTAPHTIVDPYKDNCDNCHVDGIASHSLKNITLEKFPEDIGLDFCENCHQSEYNAYSTWTTGQKNNYGNCSTSCHAEHKESQIPHIITSPYGSYCDSCHPDGTNTHNLANITFTTFPQEIKTDFCQSCHETQYDALQNGNHASRECLDCHGEHKQVINVKFETCTACHTDIPSSHDETRTDCGDCHDTDPIHRYS
jgi:hypothetical protein